MRSVLVLFVVFGAGLFAGRWLFGGTGDPAAPIPTETALSADRGNQRASRPDTAQADAPGADDAPNHAAGEPTLAPLRPLPPPPVQWTQQLLNDAYATYRQQKETRLPRELQETATEAALAYVRRSIFSFGGSMRRYVDKRRAWGTLGDSPKIVLHVHGSGSVNADTVPEYHRRYRVSVSSTPLDFNVPPGNRLQMYLDNGVIPLDRTLIIERVDIVYRLGSFEPDEKRPFRTRGTLRISIGNNTVLERKGRDRKEVRGWLVGREVLNPPFSFARIQASVQNGSVAVTAHGRYVPLDYQAATRTVREKKFRWVTEDDDGLLGDEDVTLQVLADHGGGNPRTVYLDGTTNNRIDEVTEESLWDATLDLRKNRASRAWFSNAGYVPDGKVYRVSRIEWRARLDPRKSSHSDLELRFAGKKLVSKTAEEGADLSGVWEGDLVIKPGAEKQLSLTCSYFGMAEAIVTGTVVDPDK